MNCLVGQSGGPTAVINSSLAGVIQAGIDLNYDGIFLSLNGIEGIINKNIKKVDKDLFEKILEKIGLRKDLHLYWDLVGINFLKIWMMRYMVKFLKISKHIK